MKKIKTLSFALLILLGACMFVYGGYDDSPGGQLLGVLMIVGGGMGIRNNNRKD